MPDQYIPQPYQDGSCAHPFSASSARLSSSTFTCGSPISPSSRPVDVLLHQLPHLRPPAARAPWPRAAPGTARRPA